MHKKCFCFWKPTLHSSPNEGKVPVWNSSLCPQIRPCRIYPCAHHFVRHVVYLARWPRPQHVVRVSAERVARGREGGRGHVLYCWVPWLVLCGFTPGLSRPLWISTFRIGIFCSHTCSFCSVSRSNRFGMNILQGPAEKESENKSMNAWLTEWVDVSKRQFEWGTCHSNICSSRQIFTAFI